MFDVSSITDKISENLGDMDISKLLSADFIKKFTKFDNIGSLLSNFDLPTDLDSIKDVPKEKLDEVVSKASDFSSWQEMIAKASSEFLGK